MKKLERFGKEFGTLNLVPGKKVYGEKLVKRNGREYRIWNPYRSKLGTALVKGLRNFPFNENSEILYLGAGNGTTVSHISDLATNGIIYSVEFSPRAMIDLLFVSNQRKNVVPILADANKPQDYLGRISQVDILYEDVAQKNQVQILRKNADLFLKEGGSLFLMIKARSIDVTLKPKVVFRAVEAQLSPYFKILERIKLDPYEKDHLCLVMQK